MSAKIVSIVSGSIADELEIRAGSELISVNNEKLRDYIDYKYAISAEEIVLELKSPNGEIEYYEIEKDFEETL